MHIFAVKCMSEYLKQHYIVEAALSNVVLDATAAYTLKNVYFPSAFLEIVFT